MKPEQNYNSAVVQYKMAEKATERFIIEIVMGYGWPMEHIGILYIG